MSSLRLIAQSSPNKPQRNQTIMATKNTRFLHPCESLPRAYRRLEAFICRTESCVFGG